MPKSPLRYPGGKKKVLDLIRPFLSEPHFEYREPFLGGGSVFLGKEPAPFNWVGDADPDVVCFWQSVACDPGGLCRLIVANTPTVDRWREWKAAKPVTSLERGFRLLFLNRTCFSGVITANPIGGINQTGPVKVAGRWNPDALCQSIWECHRRLSGVTITAGDFGGIIEAPGASVLMYLDPPYYHKGSMLYPVCMTPADHVRLATMLKITPHRFLLTYDDCPEVRRLYDGAYFYERSWFYSMGDLGSRGAGQELFISNFPMPVRQATLWS